MAVSVIASTCVPGEVGMQIYDGISKGCRRESLYDFLASVNCCGNCVWEEPKIIVYFHLSPVMKQVSGKEESFQEGNKAGEKNDLV